MCVRLRCYRCYRLLLLGSGTCAVLLAKLYGLSLLGGGGLTSPLLFPTMISFSVSLLQLEIQLDWQKLLFTCRFACLIYAKWLCPPLTHTYTHSPSPCLMCALRFGQTIPGTSELAATPESSQSSPSLLVCPLCPAWSRKRY